MSGALRPLAIAMGDPAGIGPELCVRLVQQPRDDCRLLAFADPDTLRAAAAALDLPLQLLPEDAHARVPGDLRLRAARTTVSYTDAGSLKIQRLDATGGVIVTRGAETARGDVAIYDFDRRLITLSGNVTLQRGTDRLSGGRLTIDLDSGLSTLDGRVGGGSPALGGDSATTPRGGRITGTFSVPKRSN